MQNNSISSGDFTEKKKNNNRLFSHRIEFKIVRWQNDYGIERGKTKQQP